MIILAQRSIQTMITLRSDIREMLFEQAEQANMTRSEYIERLILEEHFKNKYGIKGVDKAPDNTPDNSQVEVSE